MLALITTSAIMNMDNKKTYLFATLIICLVLLFPARELAQVALPGPSVAQAAGRLSVDQFDTPTNQIIVKYRSPVSLNELSSPALDRVEQRLSQAAGVELSYLRPMSGGAEVLRLTERLPSDQMAAITQSLMALPEIEYAEADTIMHPMRVPDDPRYPDQWHYFAPAPGNYGINAPPAWDITTGAANIVAAVIDTGITTHAEFSGRTLPGYDFITDAQVANDGNGRDNDPRDPGDWISLEDTMGYFSNCSVRNSTWHGTHTAGTIGAASNNHQGVAGVNWNAKILPVRVLGKCGGVTSDVIDGMRWAAGLAVPGVPNNPNPAKVINLSLGSSAPCSISYQNAINAITAAGSTVVVSAGNGNTNASGFSPANCNGVITVAATKRDGSRAEYSNYGATVEIGAPGGTLAFANDPNGVLSTFDSGIQDPVADTYMYYAGTSMAAPHVTGVVSLLYGLNPALLPNQILQILQDTATNFPLSSTCNTSICGSGIVNAGAAVMHIAVPPTVTPTPDPTDKPYKIYWPIIR